MDYKKIMLIQQIESLSVKAQPLSALVPLGNNNLVRKLSWNEFEEAYNASKMRAELENKLINT